MSLVPSLDSTIGALTVGFTVSTFLLGISTTQVYLYIINFPKDNLGTKSLVWCIWIFELVHFISIAHSIYDILVSNFGNIFNLLHHPVGLHIAAFMGVFVSSIVKGFFIYRIWHLSKSVVLTGALTILAIGAAVTYLTSNVYSLMNENALLFAKKYGWLLITCSSLSASCDVAISISLVWLLRIRLRGVGKGTGTTKIVEKLTAWTLETGLLTSVFNVGLAISVGIHAGDLIWVAFWFCLCRCYANSMFATLNGRVALRAIDNKTAAFSLPLVSLGFGHSGSLGLSTETTDEPSGGPGRSGGRISFKIENGVAVEISESPAQMNAPDRNNINGPDSAV